MPYSQSSLNQQHPSTERPVAAQPPASAPTLQNVWANQRHSLQPRPPSPTCGRAASRPQSYEGQRGRKNITQEPQLQPGNMKSFFFFIFLTGVPAFNSRSCKQTVEPAVRAGGQAAAASAAGRITGCDGTAVGIYSHVRSETTGAASTLLPLLAVR